jgi:capsular exopolysaccharide synthesis family protein
MSRINEALRRAAEEGGQESGPASPAPDAQDLSVLAREPYPVEIGAARQGSASGSSSSSSAADDDARAEEPRTKRTRNREPLFERLDSRLAEKVVTDANMSALSREQYRRLASFLHDAQNTTGMRVVMVASAVAGEGKTLTASNLALTLSESYKKSVLLIDADLRKPTLHQVFTINSALGLTDGLTSATDTKLVVHQVSERLAVLPAGRPTSDPMAGLISNRMRRLIDEAKEAFDWVIIDTPPVVLLPDANLVAAMTDAAVLVIRAHSTPHELVKRAADAIGPKRIIGTVLNQAQATSTGFGYGKYYQGYYMSGSAASNS